MSISFTTLDQDTRPDPLRCDVAIVLGLLPRRPQPLPPRWRAQLRTLGLDAALDGPLAPRPDARGLPLRCDAWADVETLFAVAAGAAAADCPSARALREFFAQGGRSVWVIAAGDPPGPEADHRRRLEALGALLRADPAAVADRSAPAGLAAGLPPADDSVLVDGSCRDLGCLRLLDTTAMILAPDLPWLLADELPLSGFADPGPLPERFVPCSHDNQRERYRLRLEGSPRLGPAAWQAWAVAVADLRRRCDALGRSDLALIAAAPLTLDDDLRPDHVGFEQTLVEAGLAHAGIQLGWPWLGDPRDRELPAHDPSGAIAGVIAREALRTGCWRSIGHRPILGSARLEPQPLRHDLPRISSLEHSPRGGLRLRHDRSTLGSGAFAFAAIGRVHGMLLRACRDLGRDLVFETNGPETWRELRIRLGTVLQRLHQAEALRGADAVAAYSVRCDASTNPQAARDGGRLIAEISYQPALPVERIHVRLALDAGIALELSP